MALRAIHNSSSWPTLCETLPRSHLPSLPGPSLGLPQTHTRARNAVRTAHQTSPDRSAPPPRAHPQDPAWLGLPSEAGRSWAANPCAPVVVWPSWLYEYNRLTPERLRHDSWRNPDSCKSPVSTQSRNVLFSAILKCPPWVVGRGTFVNS